MEAAIKYFGSQQKMARALGCSPQNIQYWRKCKRLPVMVALRIESASNGNITRQMLCPYFFN
jgi:DNA-binding transcriptional regulator YdaS (Cro superfamily)